MTYDEFVSLVVSYRRGTNLRKGQAYFNVLSDVRPDLSEQIRGTALDPYYKDYVAPEIIAFVQNNW